MPTARERKQADQERSRQAVVSRRSSRMTVTFDPRVKKKNGTSVNMAFAPELRMPAGLSPEARFMELRPKGYSPLEWMAFFTPDETLWEALAEEALYELEADNEQG